MTIAWQEELRPGVALTRIVRQATAALVAMDADRLEELARCCADLNRVWDEGGDRAAASLEMRAAAGDLALFEAILHETRANLTVLTRLHAIRLRDALAWSGGKRGIRPDGEREALGFWPCRERMPDYGDN
jgi:hypothetical protein